VIPNIPSIVVGGFTDTTTKFTRTDVADCPDLAASMTLRGNMYAALRGGAMDLVELVRKIGGKRDSVERKIRAYKDTFIIFDGKVALKERGL